MKSIFTTFPIAAALDGAAGKFIADLVLEEVAGRQPLPLIWNASNKMQEMLLAPDLWVPTVAAFGKLTSDELASVASWNADDINAFLRREKFEIQLSPWPLDRKTFGIAGLIKLLGHWTQRGDKGYHVAVYKKAFRLDRGLRFFDYGAHGETGVAIPTAEGDWVHIVRAHKAMSHFELIRYAMDTTKKSKLSTRYTGAILPQWSFQEKVDVSELIGLNTVDVADNHWRLVQALMEGKSAFGLDGMSFKAAFAAAVYREAFMKKREPQPTDLVVDYPLVMSIWRAGVQIPLGAVMIEPKDFSDEDITVEED